MNEVNINNTKEEEKIFENWSLIDDYEDELKSRDEYIEDFREYINEFNNEYYCDNTQTYRRNKDSGVRCWLWNN